MTRVAAIDCGTNTIKLLVADIDRAARTQEDLVRAMRIVRLGQDVDRTRRLADEALDRVFAAVDEYAAVIADHSVDVVRFVATSASRDAENASVFVDGVRERLGVMLEVVSGDVEAQLAYDGATRSLSTGAPAVRPPIAVLDIGGGSTELILGDAEGRVSAAHSLDIGSVRVTERLMPSDPPAAGEVTAAGRLIDEALDTLPTFGVDVVDAATFVGVAGTVTTIGMLLQGLRTWDRDRVHHSSFPLGQVHDLATRIVTMTVAEREQLGVPAGRSDVIGAGALILDRVLRRCGADRLTVSDSDILDGIAWSVA